MLNINRKLSHNGFSLIELMVAAAILAFIVFGIFQAYSTGFMGMADARDRTVATNYAREAMEDVKNMDFEKITTTTKSVIDANRKYRVDVNVSTEEESANLKKVFTVVSWQDRNGIVKTVDTTMFVNHTEIYASAATKIVLYADSYSILNETDDPEGEGTFTKLTAVIKDIKGNTVIDWGKRAGEGDITFSPFSGGGLGELSEISETLNGIATATFSSNGTLTAEVGYTVIEASVNLPDIGNVSDSVTIKITDGPVKIKLVANPEIIKASTTNCPTITASLRNAADEILKLGDLVIDVEINFSVFGEGNLSTSTITILAVEGNTTDDAIAIIDLCPTGNPGLASVVATATTDLESDSADIRFLGIPVSILVTASPNPIYVDDEGSTLTVSLLDVNGFPTNPAGEDIIVTFLLSTLSTESNGDLDPTELPFTAYEYEGILLTTLFSGQTTTEAVTITTINTAELTNSSVTINILSELVPDRIELTASPEIVKADGVSISTITATVYDVKEKIVTNYTGTIDFYKDDIFFSTNSFNKGIATITLSSDSAVTVTITADSDDLECLPLDGVEVGFYKVADRIELTASPEIVKADGVSISTITATVYDDNVIVLDYDKSIDFYIDGIFFSTNSFTNGIATITLSSDSPVTVTITADPSDDLPCLPSEGVDVVFYEETDLILVDGSVNCTPTCDIITFDIIVTGETGVSIVVDEMKIMWTESAPQERFSKILIDEEEVYTGSDKSGTIVDIENETLIPGEYTIELTFIQDMAGRQIDVMFYPPATGWYLIRFDVL